MIYRHFGKRSSDVLCSIAAIIVLSPVLVAAALAILVEDGGPVLFRQTRVGKDLREFTIFKFRSMSADAPDVASNDAHMLRVTRVGKYLRRLNIDELPQLLNILNGEMSIVGPRPALVSQNDLIAFRSELGINSAKPGLTGLAQISSYDGMLAEEKASLDAKYQQHVSLVIDVSILIKTVTYLFKPPPTY